VVEHPLATEDAKNGVVERGAGPDVADLDGHVVNHDHNLRVIRRLKVCLNGGRVDPRVPVTPAELATAASGAVAAGAEAVHMHPRDGRGGESLHAADIGAAVAAVRTAGVPVGVSTGLWICDGDSALRHRLVSDWAGLPPSARPDFASVNVHEPGYAALAQVLRDAGIGVEAGVWSVAAAEALAAGAGPVLRVLVEVMEPPAVETADRILATLDARGVPGPRLLHGEGAQCWPLVAHAGRLGLPTRIGLEDTLVGPAGEPVDGNADLVRLALHIRG
jgi:uncharacterized protein (DUF849 family)